jgi:hypothetical protein
MNRKWWLLGVPVLLIAVLGLVLSGNRSQKPESWGMVKETVPSASQSVSGALATSPAPAPAPTPAQPPLKVTPPGGSRELYPEPGDKNYADYQEMLKQPEYDLSISNSPGDKLPYDPEWRSLRTGRREVAVHDRAFSTGGSASLDELAEEYIFGLNQMDEAVLKDLRITREDFVTILWPEFPQSRPALHIPEDESWLFEIAHLNEGLQKTAALTKGRKLKLEGARVVSVKQFTNFRILEVQITAQDETTGESITVTGDKGGTVAERLGRYKFYLYRN